MEENNYSPEKLKYLKLLSQQFPTKQSVSTEIINLTAILNLPKGTEHFMSDIHGEYEAFRHILNNCSGVIREKVDMIFADKLSEEEINELCTLIYYPKERMDYLNELGKIDDDWYRKNLQNLLQVARVVSSKYTRSKVRKKLPKDFAYIIDELLHALPDEDNNQLVYHQRILDSIIGIENGDEFVIALAELIKELAVDHLHIVGDIYDRGPSADKIMNMLMGSSKDMDIEWGNHDVLWMGAASGNLACIANVIRNNIRYDNTRILENAYGVSLRPLAIFGEKYYSGTTMEAAVKAINILTLKLEGLEIKKHPEYHMEDRLLFDHTDFKNGTVSIFGQNVRLNTNEFPTIDPDDPYKLTEEENNLMQDLRYAFMHSSKLEEHIDYLYTKGSMYLIYNENLLLHGCVPLNDDGSFYVCEFGGKNYSGKALLDYCDKTARHAFFDGDEDAVDFMWYIWAGTHSPCCGRILKTWERTLIDDKQYWDEPEDSYYAYINDEETCLNILKEFGLTLSISHIINGHTPVRANAGESPIKGEGKVIVIDGGFCKAYHKTTGIAGYTLIYNSHGMRISSHEPFTDKEKVVKENADIYSSVYDFEKEPFRVMVRDSDTGHKIVDDLWNLHELLKAYRDGIIREK